MGTRAITQISHLKDSISLYTRWDGFPEEIRDDAKNIIGNMDGFITMAQQRIHDRQLHHMQPWLDSFRTRLDGYKNKKSIQDLAFYMSCFDFSHHHPDHTDNDADCYINIMNDSQTLSFRPRKRKNTPTIHNYQTIIELRSDESDEVQYLGFQNMDVDTFLQKIVMLPAFLRDLFEIIKTKDSEADSIGHLPIFRNGYKYCQLYVGHPEYNTWSSPRNNTNDRATRIQFSRDKAYSMIPLDLYPASFGTLMQLMCPENIRYITDGERVNIKADFTIHVSDRVTTIGIPIDKDPSLKSKMIQYYQEFFAHEQAWIERNQAYEHDVIPLQEGYIEHIDLKCMFIPIIEQLVHILATQYDIEHQNEMHFSPSP